MKYLFKALFFDGSMIEQNTEDKSTITEGKNCFYDVHQKIDQVRAFALYNTETNDEYLVSMEDGHFQVNQVPLYLHNENITEIRLIYFIRNIIQANIGDIQQQVHHRIFNFGFQAKNEEGKNIERIMSLV